MAEQVKKHSMNGQDTEPRKRNIRLALMLGGFALLVFVSSIPFWLGIARIIGDQAK